MFTPLSSPEVLIDLNKTLYYSLLIKLLNLEGQMSAMAVSGAPLSRDVFSHVRADVKTYGCVLEGKFLGEHFDEKILAGKINWPVPEVRAHYDPLLQQHIQDLVIDFFSDWSKRWDVLEMGAGALSSRRSYLTRLLPEARFVYSDLNIQLVVRGTSGGAKYFHASEIPNMRRNSLDAVVASSFFDVLTAGNLNSALDQIYLLLKPGGMLLHVTDLSPSINAFVIDHAEDSDDIMFPLIGAHGAPGIQFVPRSSCKEFIEKHPEAVWLKEYINTTKAARAATVVDSFTRKGHAPFLSEWVKENFPDADRTEIVNQNNLPKLKEAFAGKGFEVLKMGPQTRSGLFVQKAGGGYKEIYYSTGVIFQNNESRAAIPPGQMRMALTIQVIVARKL